MTELETIIMRLPDPPKDYYLDDMPPLTGTPKQTKWATAIRDKLADDLATYTMCYCSDGRPSNLSAIVMQGKEAMAQDILSSPLVTGTTGDLREEKIDNDIAAYQDYVARIDRFVRLMETQTTAKFWIDHRDIFGIKALKAIIDGKT